MGIGQKGARLDSRKPRSRDVECYFKKGQEKALRKVTTDQRLNIEKEPTMLRFEHSKRISKV